MGMGGVAEQIRDLKLGDLLDSAPPGVDEAVAISRVVQFLRDPKYSHFKVRRAVLILCAEQQGKPYSDATSLFGGL